jgi:hypothetical protein
MIEGKIARGVYISLYKMHQIALWKMACVFNDNSECAN